MACGVGDVSFSILAGANVPEPLCSVLGWGNSVEEDIFLSQGIRKAEVYGLARGEL